MSAEGFLSYLLPYVEGELDASERKRAYLHDPVLWAKDYLGVILWSKQREILYSIRDCRNTAVAAGHGVGKSFVAAVAMAWWIDVHPLGADESGAQQTFVASTAPFQDQITAILWNNIRVLHSLSKKRHDEYLRRKKAGRALEEYKSADHALPGYITGDNKWKLDDGTLIGQGRKPPDNKTDSGYQGLHATYLLAIGDEAAGLGADMINALGNITTGEHNRLLLIANPTDPNSEMAKIWKTNNPDWVRMTISVFHSPKITGEEFPADRMTSISGQDYIDEMRNKHGVDDPQYISRVTGEWAFDAGNNVFTELDLASAANTIVMPDPSARTQQGWDIARMGKDSTIGYRCEYGEVWETDPETGLPTAATGRTGIRVRRIDKWAKAPLVGDDPENPGSAQRIHRHALAEGAEIVAVDASGIGSGVIDGLAQIGAAMVAGAPYLVLEVFGGAPSTDRRAFTNSRAQQYFELKKRMYLGGLDLDGMDADLFDDLRGVVYEYDTKGARKIESKDDMKRRGVKSPDCADALWYAALDVSELVDSPLRDLQPGDKVVVDPYELLADELESAGMPW